MRRYYDYKWQAAEFFRSSRLSIFLFTTTIIIGVVFGCLGGAKIVATINGADISDYTVAWYVGSKSSFGSYFAAGVLDFIVSILLILFCNSTVFLMAGNFILMLLKGYLLGYNAFIIVGHFGVGGFFQIFFVFLPQQLLIAAIMIYASVCACNRCLRNRGCGFWVIHGVEYNELLKKLLRASIYFLVLNVILCVLFTLIMGKLVV